MDQPFFEIYVQNSPLGGSIVFWGLKRDFCDPGPYWFRLQWAESVNGEWVDVTPAGQPTSFYFAVDPLQRTWAVELETFYRVILETPVGIYTSFAHQATGVWAKRDWLLARDIARKENLLSRKFTGWKGWLLKRKIWGELCSCVDFDTQEPPKGDCEICYGTGKVGGYWEGYPTFCYEMQGGPQQRHKTQDENYGMRDDQHFQMRMLAYPHLSTYDIFVDESSGRRFVLRNVATAAEIKGIPIVNMTEFRLAPFTDMVYKVPIHPVVPPYEPFEPPKTEVDIGDEFLDFDPDLMPTPEPVVDISEPPGVEPTPTPEVHIPMGRLSIWWDDGQWNIGETIGEQETALYRTTDGTPNPWILGSFAWEAVLGTGAVTGIVNGADHQDVACSQPGVDGAYKLAGTYNDMYAYLKE